MGVIEESYSMTIFKFKAIVFRSTLPGTKLVTYTNVYASSIVSPSEHVLPCYNSSDSDNNNDSKSKKCCQIYNVLGGTYWNHNTVYCERIKYLKKSSRSQKSYMISRKYDPRK